jgi:hypothetical protein
VFLLLSTDSCWPCAFATATAADDEDDLLARLPAAVCRPYLLLLLLPGQLYQIMYAPALDHLHYNLIRHQHTLVHEVLGLLACKVL